jgi:hypothetical protein
VCPGRGLVTNKICRKNNKHTSRFSAVSVPVHTLVALSLQCDSSRRQSDRCCLLLSPILALHMLLVGTPLAPRLRHAGQVNDFASQPKADAVSLISDQCQGAIVFWFVNGASCCIAPARGHTVCTSKWVLAVLFLRWRFQVVAHCAAPCPCTVPFFWPSLAAGVVGSSLAMHVNDRIRTIIGCAEGQLASKLRNADVLACAPSRKRGAPELRNSGATSPTKNLSRFRRDQN